jgi:hypothetical protein
MSAYCVASDALVRLLNSEYDTVTTAFRFDGILVVSRKQRCGLVSFLRSRFIYITDYWRIHVQLRNLNIF